MDKKMDFEDFKPLLGDWAEMFRPFIESEDFFNIYDKIKKDADKERIVPSSDSVFRAFATCPFHTVKSVWYLMDPYPRLYRSGKLKIPQATGIAMDCSNSPDGKIQPSLEKFYDTISHDYGKKVEYSPSLEYLQRQGVMLLNTDLTCKLNKTGSHEGLWEPFHKFFLENIMGSKSGIVYVLSGESSKKMARYILPLGNHVINIEHPAAACHTNREWNNKNVFKLTNKLLKENKELEIFWDKKDWDEYSTPPF